MKKTMLLLASAIVALSIGASADTFPWPGTTATADTFPWPGTTAPADTFPWPGYSAPASYPVAR